MSFKLVAIGCVLTGTVLGADALTLGRSRGAAWIGQSLDLVIPVQLDAGQTDTNICAEADVFYADSRQDPARVRVTTEPTAQPDTFNVRIRSSSLVDEPVVTVYLGAGCGQKASRKYVLLADFPTEGNTPLSRVPEPVAPVVPLVAPQAAALVPQATTPVTASASQASNSAQPAPTPAMATAPAPATAPRPALPAPERKEPVTEPAKAPVKAPAKAAPAKKPAAPAADKPAATPASPKPASKPRLKLDPLENLTERIKTLESTTTALPPESAASDTARMERLQGDVRALLEQAAKNEASLTAMRERMEKAESERVPMGVVYGLVALIVACLAGLAYLWTRRPKAPVWEQGAPPAPLQPPRTTVAELAPESDDGTPSRPAAPRKPLPPDPEMDVDVNLMDMDEESFSKLMDVKPTAGKPASGKTGA